MARDVCVSQSDLDVEHFEAGWRPLARYCRPPAVPLQCYVVLCQRSLCCFVTLPGFWIAAISTPNRGSSILPNFNRQHFQTGPKFLLIFFNNQSASLNDKGAGGTRARSECCKLDQEKGAAVRCKE